jgi:hypothetical protein
MQPWLALPPLLLASALHVAAQEVEYTRADVIRTAGAFVFGASVTPLWLDDSLRFVYTSLGKNDRGTVYLVDPARANRRVYFDQNRMAAILSMAADSILDPARFPTFKPVDNGRAIELLLHKNAFRCDPASYQGVAQDSVDWALANTIKNGTSWASRSPDKKWDVFQWRYNLYLRPAALSDSDAVTSAEPARTARADTQQQRGTERDDARGERGRGARQDSIPLPRGSIALTNDGERLYTYGNTDRDVAADTARPRPVRVTINWTPDSRRFTVTRDDLRSTRIYPMYSSTGDQPIDKSCHYAVPSDSVLPTHVVYAIDIVDRTSVQAKVPPTPQTTVSSQTFWNKAGDKYFALNAKRGPSRISAHLVDAKTGETTLLVRDSTATWVELSHSFGRENWDVPKGGDDLVCGGRSAMAGGTCIASAQTAW